MLLERFHGSRILLVDDDPSLVRLLERILVRAGLEHIRAVGDGQRVMDLLPEFDPDLIILDLHMAHLDGITLLSRIQSHARGSYLPVLVLTGDVTKSAVSTALENGARDFLNKPVAPRELVLRVGNLLETRYLYRNLEGNLVEMSSRLEVAERRERRLLELREAARGRIQRLMHAGGPRMVFQPVIDLTRYDPDPDPDPDRDPDRGEGGPRAVGYIVGFEALARFPDSSGTESWFDAAELGGMAVELETGAAQSAMDLAGTLDEDWFTAVNFSPGVLDSDEAIALCAQERPLRLVVELTESSPVEDYDAIVSRLDPLREAGVRLAIDDSGAGYAGFRHLLALRPDIIKVDLEFIRGIDTDLARRAIVSSLVGFAEETRAELIAEGIETSAELHTLRDLGVRWGQGYLLGRPAPIGDWAAAVTPPATRPARTVSPGEAEGVALSGRPER